MKTFYSGLFFIFAAYYTPLATAAVDCTNPCGPDDVLYCAGQGANPKLTAQQVYDQLVSKSGTSQDAFCTTCSTKPTSDTLSTLQKQFCTDYCNSPGSYYSYTNFTNAYKAMQGADSSFSIACSGSTDDKKKELANLLTTWAQETTNGTSYTNDTLYYRYESPALAGCKDAATCKTNYYIQADYTVVAYDTTNKKVYTGYYFNSGTINADGTVSGMKVTLTGAGPSTWSWADSMAMPSGYTAKKLTDINVPEGYWIGMGNVELTADSMMGFFGWYYNHLASPTQTSADLFSFIKDYLNDGQKSFEGAFWYWNYRVNGRDPNTNLSFPTIHKVMATSTAKACHDIAIPTYMVNGTCATDINGGNFPTRKTYYTYFLSTVLGLTDNPTCVDSNGAVVACNSSTVNINSEVCYYANSPYKLRDYCYPLAE